MNTRVILVTTNETKVKTFTPKEQKLLVKYLKKMEEDMKNQLRELNITISVKNVDDIDDILMEANLHQATISKLHGLISSLNRK